MKGRERQIEGAGAGAHGGSEDAQEVVSLLLIWVTTIAEIADQRPPIWQVAGKQAGELLAEQVGHQGSHGDFGGDAQAFSSGYQLRRPSWASRRA